MMYHPPFSALHIRELAKPLGIAVLLTLTTALLAPRPAWADDDSQVLAISSDGASVLTQSGHDLPEGGYRTQFEVWQVATGKSQFRAAPLRNQGAWEAAFSPDGRYLVVGMSAQQPDNLATSPRNKAGEWILWDLELKRVVRQSVVPYGWIAQVAFSPDGRQFAIASTYDDPRNGYNGAKAFVVETATAKTLRTYQPRWSTISSLTFSPDGRTLAACGDIRPSAEKVATDTTWDGVVQLWDAHSNAARQSLNLPHCDLMGLAFPPKGETLVCRYIMRNRVLQNALAPDTYLRDMGIPLPDEATREEAKRQNLNNVLAWNPRTGQTTRWQGGIDTPELGLSFNRSQFRFNAGASTVSSVMSQSTPDPNYPKGSDYVESRWALRTWDLSRLSFESAFSEIPATTVILEESRFVFPDPIFSPDGSQLAGANNKNFIHFWDSHTGRTIGKSWPLMP